MAVDTVQKGLLRQYEQAYRERDKRDSGSHASEIRRHFLTGEPMPGIERELELARQLADPCSRCEFLQMDALNLTFEDSEFDKVICVQNGICAFGVDREMFVREALRVARPGGRLLLSSYSERFWPDRLR